MATDSHLPDTTPAPEIAPAAPAAASQPATDAHKPPLVARIETYDDAPDECTIHPADATAAELTTTWLTAAEGAFVSLDAMR